MLFVSVALFSVPATAYLPSEHLQGRDAYQRDLPHL
jgi:hypothetical protein